MEALIKKGDISDTIRTPIQFLDPAYFDPILFFIQHRDRKELNFRLRYYYEYDEYIGPLIDLHSTFPLSDFKVQCADASIQRQYEDLKDRIELLTLLQDISKDYWMLGESFPYGRWNDSEKTWDFFSLIPPEKVELRSSYITPNPIIVLQVDDQLKKLVNSGDEVDQTIVRMMDADVVEKMKSQNYIVLPPWQVTHFAKKTSRTDLRGTSVLKRALKALLYKDKLRLLQFTVVDRFMSPIKIWKLGNPQTGWIPNKAHFEMLRQLLVSASNDPDFNIIFHHGLTTEFIDQKSKVENLIPHLDWCNKMIMAALFSNEALMSGSGVTYANANVSVRVLMHRYMVHRSQLELFVNNKIFMPVAKARGYWIPDTTGNKGPSTNINGKYKILDMPKMRWSKLNLIDDTSQKQFIMRLYEKGTIPHRLIADIFDLEENDLRHQLDEEQSTVVDPLYVKARQDALGSAAVRDQVLKGKKTSDWILKAEKDEDKSKVKKSPRQNETPEIKPQPTVEESAGGTPAPGGPPAGGAV